MGRETYLCGGDLANDLSAVGRHQGVEGGDDVFELVDAAVLGHADEQVLGQDVHLQLVASAGKTVGLQLLLHRGVGHELFEPAKSKKLLMSWSKFNNTKQ